MIHLTCLAHGTHRLCEKIRILFPTVDRFVDNVKKIFRKAPTRVALFKSKYPELPLPPRPCITRWGTWLVAALYLADHFEKVSIFHSYFII